MRPRHIFADATAIFHTVRWTSWFYPKLAPVLAVAYAEMLLLNLPFLASLGRWCAILVCLSLLAAYGHVLNDIFDLDADRRAGKANPLISMTPIRRSLLCFLLLLSGLVPLFFSLGTAAWVVLLLNYLLATAYSAPPLRLKERGMWGVFADACAVHALPTIFALSLFSDLLGSEPQQLSMFAAAIPWAFLFGVRGIIVHQVWDHANDRKAGTVTFVTSIGPQRARRIAATLVFPGEIAALLALTALLAAAAPVAPMVLAIYVGVDLLRRRLWHVPLDPAPPSPGSYIVLADFYQVWLPVALAIQLGVRRPAFLVLPLLHVLIFWSDVNLRAGDVAVLLANGLRRLAARFRARAGRKARPIGGAARTPPRVRSRAPFEVIVASPFWTLNGVNVFSANLVRTLCQLSIPARILLTEEHTDLVTITDPRLPLALDLPVEYLPVARGDGWGAHWGATIRYLEERAPCIYIPNSDWRHSCVSPRLSDKVIIVGVVHSDDPLHYDHVSRLGRYWNSIVTVSEAIATKVIAMDPTLERRICTIPIGVNVAEGFPERSSSSAEPLKLVYHGLLVQRQKRILDLPRIVDALAARHVPVELTIVGGGSEQPQLLAAARHLLERGTVRFLGVLPNDQVLRLLEQADVFIMTSAFEGLPNALLEAMGRGCIPVVTHVESGIPEVVRDGVNGFLVPVGDIDTFADRLALLHHDLGRRHQMARDAYRTVSEGTYRTHDMVQGYLALFQRVLDDARHGRFRRPLGPFIPPPAQVAGVNIFPVECPTTASGIGTFPSDADARDFRRQVNLLAEARPSRLVWEPKRWNQARRVARIARMLDQLVRSEVERSRVETRGAARVARISDFTVIVASPYWALTGVNVFSANLVRGLGAEGISAHILLTEQDTRLVNIPDPLMPLPSDIPVHQLPVGRLDGWGRHWAAMIRYLEAHAPCVYIPNHDWRHSCVSPMLSTAVAIVGVLHGDDPLHYDHVARLGRYWNAIVAVSQAIAARAAALDACHAERIITIPYGVSIAAEMPERYRTAEMPLAMIYHGVLNQRQKRILDLPRIVDTLAARHIPVELTIVGGGSEQPQLLAAARHLLERGTVRFLGVLPNDQVLRLLEQADVFIMTSAFEGLPNALLEAMGRGCIPVVTHVESGIPEVVRDGVNGFLVPVGDIDTFADRLALLHHDLGRRHEMALQAYRTANEGTHRTHDMVQGYLALFQRVLDDARHGRFRRPRGPFIPPPAQVAGINIFPVDLAGEIATVRESRLPTPVRMGIQLARRVRNRLR